jgi:hypothetical protein
MKKLLLGLLMSVMLVSSALAAGPTIEERQYMQFTAADQETTTKFRIYTIAWVSFTGSIIVDTNVLNIEDGAGTEILKMTADAVQTQFVINFPNGLDVSGIKVEDLTKGYVYIYGKRR